MPYITKLLSASKRIIADRRAFITVAAPGLFCLAAIFSFTDSGHNMNISVFVKSMLKLRDLTSKQTLHKDLRIVVYDDSSAQRLDHPPTVDEWINIANKLGDLGFEKVIFPELYEMPEASPTASLNAKITLVAGNAVQTRTSSKTELELPGLLTVSDKLKIGEDSAITEAGGVLHYKGMGYFPQTLNGSVNLLSDYETKVGYFLNGNHFIPHISLLAIPDLRISGTRLTSSDAILPVELGDNLYVEQMNPSAIANASIPVRPFFDFKTKQLKENLSPTLQQVLKGGKVAIFVSDGNTGSADFVDSYIGLVPSYYGVASMINNAMGQRFVRDLPAQNVTIAIVALLFFSIGIFAKPISANLMLVVSWAAILGLGIFLYFHNGLVLPVAQASVLLVVGLVSSQVQHSIHSWQEDLKKQKDLELGKVVQTLTLPAKMRGSLGNWDYEIAYEPFGPMSGDWVQIYENRDPNHPIRGILAIGDVIGKGPSAALNTASIAAMWSHFKVQWDQGIFDIDAFISTLNQNIHRTFSGNQMTSISVAILLDDRIQLLNCASPAWLQITPNAAISSVRNRPANPLGFSEENFEFSIKELPVETGSILLAHTDGVMDGMQARKSFTRSINAAGLPETNVFEYLKREAMRAGESSVLPDDVTLLYLKKSA